MAVAVNVELPKLIVRRVVDDTIAVPKGTLMKITATNTVAASAANEDPFGGIAVEEKTADDGIVDLGCAMDGVWLMDTTAAAIGIGVPVMIGGANSVAAAVEADWPLGTVCGVAEMVRTGTNRIRVRIGGGAY